jgi:hypothetical protein
MTITQQDIQNIYNTFYASANSGATIPFNKIKLSDLTNAILLAIASGYTGTGTGGSLSSFLPQAEDNAGGYFGFVDPSNGAWYILKITPGVDPIVFGYKAGANGFTAAWNNRSTYTYTTADVAFA